MKERKGGGYIPPTPWENLKRCAKRAQCPFVQFSANEKFLISACFEKGDFAPLRECV